MNKNKENDANLIDEYGSVFRTIRAQIQKECPESEDLLRYFKKELPTRVWESVAWHVEICAVCAEALKSLEEAERQEAVLPETWNEIEKEMDARVYGRLEELAPSASRQKPSLFDAVRQTLQRLLRGGAARRRLAYAASLVVLVLVGLYGYGYFTRPLYLELAQIRVRERGVLRGERTSPGTLQKGMEALTQGRYGQAMTLLEAYLREHPDHFQANYFLGLAHLLNAREGLPGLTLGFDASHVRAGVACLEKALSLAGENEFYREDCLWHLGKAYLMLDDPETARRYFERIVALPNPNLMRKGAAEEMIRRIDDMSKAR